MSDTLRQVTHKNGRRYYEHQGERLPSVTTVLNVLPKPALLPWAVKITATEAIENIGKYWGMAKADPEKAIQVLKRQHLAVRDAKAGIGTEIHEYAEALLTGESPPELSEGAQAYASAVDAFLVEHHVEPTLIEAAVANLDIGYAGTLDLRARVDGRDMILDWKTSGGIYLGHELQQVAYVYATHSVEDETLLEWERPEHGAALVKIAPQGEYELHPVPCTPEQFQVFEAALVIYKAQSKSK